MYRNLYIVAAGCLALVAVFLATFTGVQRPRADFVFNNGTEPQTLDPVLQSGEPESQLAIGLFEGLTAYHPETLEPMPGVAKKWETDGLRYVFHLREDAYWVKRGEIYKVDGQPRRVEARDFIETWRRHLVPETGSEYSYLLYPIAGAEEFEHRAGEHWKGFVGRSAASGRVIVNRTSLTPEERAEVDAWRGAAWDEWVKIKALDRFTLEIVLKSPTPYFPSLVAFHSMAPVCREAVEAGGDRWTLPDHIVTNGPYWLEEWRFNSHIRFRKNEHYWENAQYARQCLARRRNKEEVTPEEKREGELLERFGPFVEKGLDTMEALAVEEQNTSLNLYLDGEVDRLREVPSEVVGDLIRYSRERHGGFGHLHHAVVQNVYFFELNTRVPAFALNENGRKLRRAMSLAVDRATLIDIVTRAYQKPAYRIVPPGLEGYSNQPLFGNDGDDSKNVVEAQRLVAEVRAAGVRIPKFRVLYNTHEGHAKIAAFLQSLWKTRLGIDTDLANQEWGVFLDSRRTGNYDIARAGWIADYADPNTFLDLFTTTNQNNDPRYSNPHYDRLIMTYASRILTTLATDASRQEMLRDIARWPAYRETIGRRPHGQGQTLDQAIRSAVEQHAKENRREKQLEWASKIRLLLFEAAEEMLMYDMPIIPMYFYTVTCLWPPELEGFFNPPRQFHPLKTIRWKDGRRPLGPRFDQFPRFTAELPTLGSTR